MRRLLLIGLVLVAGTGFLRNGGASGAGGPPGTVPNVVGKRLVAAEDALSGGGFHRIERVDATGRSRAVLNAQNWVVRSQTPAPGARVATGTTVTLRVGKPSDPAGARPTAAGVMPNVLCADLQAAQDALRRAGFSSFRSTDALGKGRAQFVRSNWLVTAQSVRAGTRPAPTAEIVLSVVKYGEPTGRSRCPS